MAQLLTADRWVDSGSVGAYLREVLSDDFIVVANCTILRYPISAIVLSPTALTIIYTFDDPEQMAQAGSTEAVRARSQSVLKAFLDDEFPRLPRSIRELEAMRDWNAPLLTWQAVAAGDLPEQTLADALEAAEQNAEPWLDRDVRETLGKALRDRQLTSSQRAFTPFVFRSGSAFRTGHKAWTIRDAITHMDRHPDDGIHHLQDGTLATWLEREGALHLAELARSVVRGPRVDMHVALEDFLQGSEQVARPKMAWRPRRVDLGYVVKGERAARVVKVRQAAGRGYLYGEVTTSEPWLTAEPREFHGPSAEIVVTADTQRLPIAVEGHRAKIFIASNATAVPVEIPVRMRVVALAAPADKYVLRPLIGMVIAGAAGFGAGWLWPLAGITAPAWATELGSWSPGGPWPLLVMLVWALGGLIRGLRQPQAWPTRYAIARWLVWTAVYSLCLAVIAFLLAWSWMRGLAGSLRFPPVGLVAATVVGLSAGFLPATVREIENSRRTRDPGHVLGRQSVRRAVAYWSLAVLVLLTVAVAPSAVAPVVREASTHGAAEQARGWVDARWSELDDSVGRMVDRLTLRYYGH